MRFIVLLLAAISFNAWGIKTEHVEADLVAARTAAEPGGTLTVALRLRMIPHWHTYWRNPGDSGQPTQIEWQLPAGWRAGEIQWPAPRRLPAKHLMNFGYEDEVLLLTDIAVPKDASGSAKLVARATWLVCNEDRCIPEEGDVALTLPVGAGGPGAQAQAIERARASLPQKAPADWRFSAKRTEAGVDLEIAAPRGVELKSAAYFPYDEGRIHNAAPQPLEGGVLKIRNAEQRTGPFNRVKGLVVLDGRALEVDVPVSGGPGGGFPGLALALAFAFLGGLILNLMPCVLPVLSIKVLGFAGHGSDSRAMRLNGALFALGVVVSFWVLAGLLAGFNALGGGIGWGFQLQSPVIVALLATLFLVLALNLSGFFEFAVPGLSRITGIQSKNTRVNSLLSGVLAVAIASPCTAPFMGSAIGYALGESALTTLLVFTALGAGMALPYLALSWNPGWLRWVPKPGPWMKRFKQALAVPLYATVVWLAWVFALQAGMLASPSGWEKFSEASLERYTAQGKPVFVDYTAAWCVTCQVNKQLVLGRPEVEQALRDSGVTLLRADWTRRDAEITRALDALGRKGVPVYAIYRQGREPQLLPEILTRDLLLAAITEK
jgi:DsbC/DsbD-like thiol-disulfide interchange protein/cytochrome c biogenesis protein CcdA